MADDTRLNADGAEEEGGAPHKEADEALERYKLHSSEGERLLAKEYSSSAIASFVQAAGFIGSIKEVQVRRQRRFQGGLLRRGHQVVYEGH